MAANGISFGSPDHKETLKQLIIDGNTLAYEVTGEGPLVVLAHGLGDSRHSYRFLAPALAAAGYRVANVDLRGCGDSSLGWDGYTRTDIAGDLLAVVRHVGGPAVIIGQSISGGAGTIAAATAPELINGVIGLAPFTRKQSFDLGGLLSQRRYRAGYFQMAKLIVGAKLSSWTRYLGVAMPVKPVDWDAELSRITEKLSEPGRMKVLQTMAKSDPGDAGAQLGNLTRPVLVVEGSRDPDWASPRAEGERILGDFPRGVGTLSVIEGAGTTRTLRRPTRSWPWPFPSWTRPCRCPVPRVGLATASVTEAGAALADETGFHELSMGVLAGRLGVRTPSLYKHVDSLADLSRRVAALAATELADALRDATEGQAGRDALAAVARTVWTYAREHPGRWTAVNSARPIGPDDPLVAARDRLLACFAAGLRDYRLSPDESLHALRMLQHPARLRHPESHRRFPARPRGAGQFCPDGRFP